MSKQFKLFMRPVLILAIIGITVGVLWLFQRGRGVPELAPQVSDRNTGREHDSRSQPSRARGVRTDEPAEGATQSVATGRRSVTSGKQDGESPQNVEKRLLASLASATKLSDIHQLRLELMEYYADHNPEAGIKWLGSLDASENISAYLKAYGARLASRALDWKELAKLLPTGSTSDFMAGALGVAALGNARGAWHESMALQAQGRLSAIGLNHVFHCIATEDPNLAMELRDPNEKPEYALQLFAAAGFQSHEAALEALSGVQDPKLRTRCGIEYIRKSLTDDMVDFGNSVLTRTEPAEVRDRWLEEVVGRLFTRDLSNTARFTNAISNDDLRKRVVDRVLTYAAHVGGGFDERARELFPQE